MRYALLLAAFLVACQPPINHLPTSSEPPEADHVHDPWEKDIPAVVNHLLSIPRANREMIAPVAIAIARESYEAGVDPLLVANVVRVENPWLKPDTASYAGAIGIMQVMGRYWGDSFTECGDDLSDVDTNVCVGTRILKFYIDGSPGDLGRALLRYNGCVSTPGCERYANWVMGDM